MSRNSKSFSFSDFSGGLNSNSSPTSLNTNEAIDLQNINILTSSDPSRSGLESRRGNSVFNSSAMVSSSTAVSGLGYFRTSGGSDFLMAIAGTKIFKADSLDGTMDDVTGAVTITSGGTNTWTHSTMNDLSIFVGGAPNAPIKYSGSGNAAALGGSPPSGAFGILANNRFFIGNTAANPSRIAWSILGNPQDWTGTGSGTQDVSTNDGDTLIGAALLGVDHLVLFKQNSIHELVIRNAPFPLYNLFRNVGAVSKRGIVVVDSMAYFITPQPRMKATDGTKVFDFPDIIDNVWDGLNRSRLNQIHGIYYPKLRQIMWFCSNGSATTHDYCIVWDLEHKCWLRHPTGYKMNASVIAQDYLLYSGAYDGKIYLQDAAVTADASETSPGKIDSYWKSGWLSSSSILNSKSVKYCDMNFSTQVSGVFDFSVGYDFDSDRISVPVDMQAAGGKYDQSTYDVDSYGGLSDKTRIEHLKGNGKFFQFKVRHNSSTEAFSFNGFEVPIKENAVKAA